MCPVRVWNDFMNKRDSEIREKINNKLKNLIKNENTFGLSRDSISKRSRDFFEYVAFFDRAKSLMSRAEKEILEYSLKGKSFYRSSLFAANKLFSAKGRMEREWWSERGGIYISISLFPKLNRENKDLYGLAIPVSICQELSRLGIFPEIRWLNDILLNGKKICGVLTRAFNVPATREEYIIFGIGININQKRFPSYLKDIATSLAIEEKRHFDTEKLLVDISSRIAFNFSILEEWEAKKLENLMHREIKNPVLEIYQSYSNLINRKVLYGMDLEKTKGEIFVSRGIDERGKLRLFDGSGHEFLANTGEIRFFD